MGLFEYLFERKNPGNIGSIQKNEQKLDRNINIPILIFKLIITLSLLGGAFYVTVYQNFTVSNLLAFVVIMLVYCIISYLIIPKPDTSNVGMLGGFLDNPLKYTDDVNRMLTFLLIILYPGRFISKTIIQTFMLLGIVGKK
jgi:hypothetical protein